MRELVIVITDLYLPEAQPRPPRARRRRCPGSSTRGATGERVALTAGWRAWLARRLGRDDLAALAPGAHRGGGAAGDTAEPQWLATPVHLSAGLSRVHLDHRGSAAPERRGAGSAHARLRPRLCRLGTSRSQDCRAGSSCCRRRAFARCPRPSRRAARARRSPRRCPAGRKLRPCGAWPPRLRCGCMGQQMNAVRTRLGRPSVNALWLWGGGDCHRGARCRGRWRPRRWVSARTRTWMGCGGCTERAAGRLPRGPHGGARPGLRMRPSCSRCRLPMSCGSPVHASFAQALAALDARFIAPALAALQAGELAGVTLLANDTALTVRRRSAAAHLAPGPSGTCEPHMGLRIVRRAAAPPAWPWAPGCTRCCAASTRPRRALGRRTGSLPRAAAAGGHAGGHRAGGGSAARAPRRAGSW